MWIMVSGPYTAGNAGPERRAKNLQAMNDAALELFRAGHQPVIGVNMALPIIEAAGGGEDAFEEIMMPLSLDLADRCDACLRVGGPSKGADDEMERFKAQGRPVYRSVDEVPKVDLSFR